MNLLTSLKFQELNYEQNIWNNTKATHLTFFIYY